MITQKIKIGNFFYSHSRSIQNIAHHIQSLFDGVITQPHFLSGLQVHNFEKKASWAVVDIAEGASERTETRMPVRRPKTIRRTASREPDTSRYHGNPI